jgi:hypothetical protein
MPGRLLSRTVGSTSSRGRAVLLAMSLCAGLALSVAGCGNSGLKRLSTTALAAKGDAICERLKYALNAADGQAGWATLTSRAKLSVLFAAAEERASKQLAALKPQAALEPEWQRTVALRRALVPYHHRLAKYASRGEADKVEAVYTAYKAAQWRMQLAFKHSRFGFKICWDIG